MTEYDNLVRRLREPRQRRWPRYALFLLMVLTFWLAGFAFSTAKPNEVICYDPQWEETDFAVVSATCEGGVTVHWVD